MPQLDFNLFFSNFVWLIFSLVFFYVFILMYVMPKLLKVLVLRKFLMNHYYITQLELSLKYRSLTKAGFIGLRNLLLGFYVK